VVLLVARQMAPGDHLTARQDSPGPVPSAHGLAVVRKVPSADPTSISISVTSENFISSNINDDFIDREKGTGL
jgi:hypothetical protein